MEPYKHFIQVLYFVYQRHQHYKFTDDSQMNLRAVIGAREGKMQANKQINLQCCSILLQKCPIEQFDYLFSINKTKMFNFFKFTQQTNEVAGDIGKFLLYKIKKFTVKSRSFFMFKAPGDIYFLRSVSIISLNLHDIYLSSRTQTPID